MKKNQKVETNYFFKKPFFFHSGPKLLAKVYTYTYN